MFYEKDPDDKVEIHEELFSILVYILRNLLLLAASSHSIHIASLSMYAYFSTPESWRSNFFFMHTVPLGVLLLIPNALVTTTSVIEGVSFRDFARIMISLAFPIYLDIYTCKVKAAKSIDPDASLFLRLECIPRFIVQCIESLSHFQRPTSTVADVVQEEKDIQEEPPEERPQTPIKTNDPVQGNDHTPSWLQKPKPASEPCCVASNHCANEGKACPCHKANGPKSRRLRADLGLELPSPPPRQSKTIDSLETAAEEASIQQEPLAANVEEPTTPEKTEVEKALDRIAERKQRSLERRRKRPNRIGTFTRVITVFAYTPVATPTGWVLREAAGSQTRHTEDITKFDKRARTRLHSKSSLTPLDLLTHTHTTGRLVSVGLQKGDVSKFALLKKGAGSVRSCLVRRTMIRYGQIRSRLLKGGRNIHRLAGFHTKVMQHEASRQVLTVLQAYQKPQQDPRQPVLSSELAPALQPTPNPTPEEKRQSASNETDPIIIDDDKESNPDIPHRVEEEELAHDATIPMLASPPGVEPREPEAQRDQSKETTPISSPKQFTPSSSNTVRFTLPDPEATPKASEVITLSDNEEDQAAEEQITAPGNTITTPIDLSSIEYNDMEGIESAQAAPMPLVPEPEPLDIDMILAQGSEVPYEQQVSGVSDIMSIGSAIDASDGFQGSYTEFLFSNEAGYPEDIMDVEATIQPDRHIANAFGAGSQDITSEWQPEALQPMALPSQNIPAWEYELFGSPPQQQQQAAPQAPWAIDQPMETVAEEAVMEAAAPVVQPGALDSIAPPAVSQPQIVEEWEEEESDADFLAMIHGADEVLATVEETKENIEFEDVVVDNRTGSGQLPSDVAGAVSISFSSPSQQPDQHNVNMAPTLSSLGQTTPTRSPSFGIPGLGQLPITPASGNQEPPPTVGSDNDTASTLRLSSQGRQESNPGQAQKAGEASPAEHVQDPQSSPSTGQRTVLQNPGLTSFARREGHDIAGPPGLVFPPRGPQRTPATLQNQTPGDVGQQGDAASTQPQVTPDSNADTGMADDDERQWDGFEEAVADWFANQPDQEDDTQLGRNLLGMADDDTDTNTGNRPAIPPLLSPLSETSRPKRRNDETIANEVHDDSDEDYDVTRYGRGAQRVEAETDDGDDVPQFAPMPPEVMAYQQRQGAATPKRAKGASVPLFAPIPSDVQTYQQTGAAVRYNAPMASNTGATMPSSNTFSFGLPQATSTNNNAVAAPLSSNTFSFSLPQAISTNNNAVAAPLSSNTFSFSLPQAISTNNNAVAAPLSSNAFSFGLPPVNFTPSQNNTNQSTPSSAREITERSFMPSSQPTRSTTFSLSSDFPSLPSFPSPSQADQPFPLKDWNLDPVFLNRDALGTFADRPGADAFAADLAAARSQVEQHMIANPDEAAERLEEDAETRLSDGSPPVMFGPETPKDRKIKEPKSVKK